MATAASGQQESLEPRARNAIRGAFFGFFVDMFDIYLPIVVLAPALIYFVAPEMGTLEKSVVSGTIFAATLLGRPIGSIIFGHFADSIGRKRTTIISVSGFGVVTLLIALLPGYQQWGITAVILLIVLRLVDGVFLGGEYTSANPLAMEYSPKEKRGFYSAVIMSGYPLAFAAISAITTVLLLFIPAGDINSPYVQWGWRIPFVIGSLLAFALVFYYVRFVDESEIFEESGGGGSPLRQLFTERENLMSFLQVFVLMTGFWLTLQTVAAILPSLLGSQVGLSQTNTTITLVVSNVVLVGGYIASGVISQRVGRRNFMIVYGLVAAVVGTFLYYLLLSSPPQNLFLVILLTTIITLLVVSCWGITTAYINERFQTGIRASAFGIGYSLAVVLPSLYAYYQAGLAAFMPFEYTVLVLLALGSLLMVVGALWGPETKDVDFSSEVDVEATGAGDRAPDTSPTEPRTAPGSGGTLGSS
ncbi:MAG: Putative metabolite transport protein [uncultured Rubrobacteraceae bacterium]|uniref:Metabolite transport protein n=1 Tax=uncultured Rubrobacteraceae bacterium TaxID=349277 RepID=A0A6J4RCX8_9ACTN|nr:MAG: Putative metabolite transport protein [uncultured Rubrobacteraceae bacterium]